MGQLFPSINHVVEALRPEEPVFCIRPHILRETARRFIEAFPGDVLYAVKCNEHPAILQALYEGGLRHFDTASVQEIRGVTSLMEGVTCHFMHPVKSPEAIEEAYFTHGVKSFVLDHIDELEKIMEATGYARDLLLVVRLAMPHNQAMLSLNGKFGCDVEEGARLLRLIKASGNETGLTFHVGSQCLHPSAFEKAITICGQAIAEAGFPVDVLDVGGGFPAQYNGDEPAFEAFIDAVKDACKAIDLDPSTRLQCEPGRALVAEGMSVVTRVELRRDHALYLNDGTYGGLAELRFLGACFPMRIVRPGADEVADGTVGFDLFGPTCDSIDSMPGPHWLSDDVKAGDWIEIQKMGAYSNSLRTRFNGFVSENFVAVYDDAEIEVEAEAVVVPLRKVRSAA